MKGKVIESWMRSGNIRADHLASAGRHLDKLLAVLGIFDLDKWAKGEQTQGDPEHVLSEPSQEELEGNDARLIAELFAAEEVQNPQDYDIWLPGSSGGLNETDPMDMFTSSYIGGSVKHDDNLCSRRPGRIFGDSGVR